MKEGYVLTGKSFFPSTCVVLKLNPTDKDALRITSFEDATYYMSGGYPRPDMTNSATLVVRVGTDKESIIDNLFEKMKAGWFVQSLTIGKSAVITRDCDKSTLCTDIEQLEDIVYSIHTTGGMKA